MCRVVDTVLVKNEGVGERADLEQTVPVGRVAGESRDLEPKDNPRTSHAHVGHQPLKTLPLHCRSTRQSEVGINDDDALCRPTQSHRALA